MAVVQARFGNQQFFIGLSSDTKPTNVIWGDKFLETDTQNWFVWAGQAWAPFTDAVALAGATFQSGLLNTALWVWQPSTLSWIKASADASGNLLTSGGGGGGTQIVQNIRQASAPVAPTSVMVTTTSGTVAAANASRKGIVLVNLGQVNVSFGIGVTAVYGQGLTLTPNGTWEMKEYTYSPAAITAITQSGTAALSVQEFN